MGSFETGPLPPQQMAQLLERAIIPSMEALAKMEEEKKILAGGGIVGVRAGVGIMEVASNEELSRTLVSLPFWGLMKVEVTPLQTFEEKAAEARQNLERVSRQPRSKG